MLENHVVLVEEYDSERQSPIEWLKFITKNICLKSDKVFVLIYINERNRSLYDINNDNFRIECMRLTTDDEYNIQVIKNLIENYIKL